VEGGGPRESPGRPRRLFPFVPLRGVAHHPPPHPTTCSNKHDPGYSSAAGADDSDSLSPQPQVRSAPPPPPPPAAVCSGAADGGRSKPEGSAMSFADLEAGALRAPVGRKARGGPNDARGLVFQITTAVASYRRLLNSLGTPKDTPTLRDQLSVLELLLRVLIQESA